MSIRPGVCGEPCKSGHAAPAYPRHGKALASAVCLSLAATGPCLGVDYTFDANATLQQNYNTNILLSPSSLNPEPVWGIGMDARLGVLAADTRWQASANARFDNWFYGPVSGLDMQNQYVDTHYVYLTERSRYELTGNFTSDALLSSTTNTNSTDLVPGIIFGRVQREVKTAAPSWTYSLDEYTKINLRYAYIDSNYPTVSSAGSSQSLVYPNSTSHSLSSYVSHVASEYLSLTGQISDTYFTTAQRTINYLNLTVGLKYLQSADSEIAISGGGQFSQSTTHFTSAGQSISLASDQFSPLADISLTKKFQYTNLALTYAHQSSPSINSALFTSDFASFNVTHQWTPHLDSGFSLSYYHTATPTQSGTAYSQNAYQVGGSISYRLAENTVIDASYSYKIRDLGTGTSAYQGFQDAHILSLSLRYDFGKAHY